jgi:hypothetical protein
MFMALLHAKQREIRDILDSAREGRTNRTGGHHIYMDTGGRHLSCPSDEADVSLGQK